MAATMTMTTTTGAVPLPRMVDPNLSLEVQAQEIRECNIAEAWRHGRLDRAVMWRRMVVEVPASSVGEKRKQSKDDDINLDIMVTKVCIGLCWFLDLADFFFL